MLIDCHTHAFAEKIAPRAVQQLVDYYGLPTNFGGSLQDLLTTAVDAKLDALVLLNAATKPEQVRSANDWLMRLAEDTSKTPQVIPFGTFHPDDPHWLSEIQRLRSAGIRGIKLHPEFQRIDLADVRLNDFFAEVEQDFILMIHIGDREVRANNLSTPRKLASIMDKFPRLRAIAAHMGGYIMWQEAYECLVGRNVYLDTSSTFPYIDKSLLRKIMTKHSKDHILFGSDYPLRMPQQDFPFLKAIRWLNDDEKERILGINAARLLGLI
jgi:predicted TIM-barrel fold metal-dependent hydrolase